MLPQSEPVQFQNLQVNSSHSALPEVTNWFEQFKQRGIPEQIWLEANMALIESFTNAVRHAHQDLPDDTAITIEVFVGENTLTFQVWDEGEPYDFEAALAALDKLITQPDFDPLVREKQWGGVIFLRLRQWHNWAITYERRDDFRNCLQATKAF